MIGTIWAVAGLLLVLSEFVVPQFVVFFFGAGALLNALLVTVVPPLRSRITVQLLLWFLTSGVSLWLLRRYVAGWFRGDDYVGEDESALGKTGTVVETIPEGGSGRVRFGGTTWQAQCLEGAIDEGATVTVLEKRGVTLVVTPGDLLHREEEQ